MFPYCHEQIKDLWKSFQDVSKIKVSFFIVIKFKSETFECLPVLLPVDCWSVVEIEVVINGDGRLQWLFHFIEMKFFNLETGQLKSQSQWTPYSLCGPSPSKYWYITHATSLNIPREEDGWLTYPTSLGIIISGGYHSLVWFTYYLRPCFFRKIG